MAVESSRPAGCRNPRQIPATQAESGEEVSWAETNQSQKKRNRVRTRLRDFPVAWRLLCGSVCARRFRLRRRCSFCRRFFFLVAADGQSCDHSQQCEDGQVFFHTHGSFLHNAVANKYQFMPRFGFPRKLMMLVIPPEYAKLFREDICVARLLPLICATLNIAICRIDC